MALSARDKLAEALESGDLHRAAELLKMEQIDLTDPIASLSRISDSYLAHLLPVRIAKPLYRK